MAIAVTRRSSSLIAARPCVVPRVLLRLVWPSPLVCHSLAGKRGFGDSNRGDGGDERQRKAGKSKRVNIRREEAPIPNQGQLQRGGVNLDSSFMAVEKLEDKLSSKEEEADFSKRLAVIRFEGQERRKVGKGSTQLSSLDSTAVFDNELNYASPPSLSDTLMSQLNSDVSDPKLKNAQFGPNQVGVAVAALLLVLMFVVVSGGDFASSKRYKGVRPAQQAPDGIEAALIKGRIAQLENAREADPSDMQVLEEEAVSYAQLFEFEKSAGLLDQLVAVQPRNAEAWRLLGETTLLSQQSARSVAAYEKAAALSSDDLQVLTGLADAYIANGTPSKAIDSLNAIKASRAAKAAPAATAAAPAAAAAASPSSSSPPSPSPSIKDEGASDSAPASEGSTVDLGALELLLAKVYSSWNGHDSDALSTYDGLIKMSPTDFRGYLAKGLFLKEHGRKADSERMFIQARFYAPESRQAFIRRMSDTNPMLELPSDD